MHLFPFIRVALFQSRSKVMTRDQGSVDEVWAKLQALSAGKIQREKARLKQSTNVGWDELITPVPEKPQPKLDAFSIPLSRAHPAGEKPNPSPPSVVTSPNPVQRTDPIALTYTELESILAKDINALKEKDTKRRRQALTTISDALLTDPRPPVPVLEEAIETAIGKGLLRCFDDPSEATRELAITVFTRLLEVAPNSSMALQPYLFPVLEERLIPMEAPEGSHISVIQQTRACLETSDHIRLQLYTLLLWLVQELASAMQAYAAEVLEMVKEGEEVVALLMVLYFLFKPPPTKGKKREREREIGEGNPTTRHHSDVHPPALSFSSSCRSAG